MKKGFALAQAIEECEKQLASAVKKLYGIASLPAKVEVSKQFGDLSFPCFPLASQAKKNPNEIAEKITQYLNAFYGLGGKQYAEKVEAVGGYVNFFLNDGYHAQSVEEALDKDFGGGEEGKGKKAVVEFSSPNMGKPMHVGHIRSTILGDAIALGLRKRGYKVIRSNYLCEAGTQVAKLLLGLKKYKVGAIKDEKQLLDYYIKINAEIDKDEKLEKQVHAILEKMEDGDAATLKQLKTIRKITLKPFKENYAKLGVRFEEEIFDSDFVNEGKKLALEAKEKGIARIEKDGELVAFLEEYGIPNLVILRSNGTTLYSTRDLSLADSRFRIYNPAISVIVTGSDQLMHFKQVYKMLELMGRDYTNRFKHVGFGLIYLEGGKLSSRKGNVFFLEDLLDDAIESASAQIRGRETMGKKEIKGIAQTIGVGSIKFGFLRVSNAKNITFNPEKAVSFEGDTGAYVQYNAVRAKNILRKAGGNTKASVPKNTQFNDAERKVSFMLSLYPDVARRVSENFEPHALCDYLLKLSAAFSEFYEKCPVVQSEGAERQKRLAIVAATLNAIESGLSLLGITVPKKM
ncbi:arginine--tRNA ligase [Candidatus Micrarchaeota archaeon]|nr:arginine--tRNA ligase [Candidatus Micrarchaeota archaeon]